MLARKTRIAQSTISAVLNGDRIQTRSQVAALAKFLHVGVDAFLPA
jgi:hypothetical protein